MKSLKRAIKLLCALFLISSLIHGQSLVELAKKEKERRAKLKKKSSVVITNADLARLKKRPAIQVTIPPPSLVEKPQKPPPSSSPQIRVTNRTPQREQPKQTTSSPAENVDQQETPVTGGSLEEKLKKAQEMVGLLTLKMNALWQEFYSLDDMTPRDLIQKQISETYLQLQQAKAEEEKLKKQLEASHTRRKR